MSGKKHPVLVVDLPEPIYGYWDGGKKSHFVFEPNPRSFINGDIRWGSYSANFFFTAGAGVSWNTAISYAKKKLTKMLKVKGAEITVEWKGE